MILIIITYLISLIAGAVEGFVDGKKTLKKKNIEHKLSALFRAVGAAVFVWVFGLYYWLLIPILLLYSVGLDVSFNMKVKNTPWYIGKTSEIDKLIRETPINEDGQLYQFCKLFIAGVLFLVVAMI